MTLRPGSPLHEEFVEAFQVGVAALDVGKVDTAEENLTKAIEKVPREPAAWANRGLLYLRTDRLDQAAQDLQRAHDLEMSALAHRHQLQRAVLEDAGRLRDVRLARLREDAKELTRALFELERLALLMQWGESADKDEMKRVELAAR